VRRLFQTLLAGIALVGLALVSALAAMRLAIHGAEVRVPSLAGMTVAQALDTAHAQGLQLEIADHVYSASTPAGHILNQMPQPGVLVRRMWKVRVTESLGPQTVSVPDVTGMNTRLAIITIRRSGFKLGEVNRLPFSSALPDTVIAQSPSAHASAVESPQINLLLADPFLASEQAYAMPNLVGEPYATASQTVLQAGLLLAPVLEVSDKMSASGIVLGQVPEAGSRVEAGAEVRLVVEH
jgi:beta-lactam-binding protein with PASTA domain